jgi:hypothetical protein
MCFLPPPCLFCLHYNDNAGFDDPDCEAFREIPDEIFRGRCDHFEHFTGDGGVHFELNPCMAEEFDEVNELRREMDLPPFRDRPVADRSPDR